MPLLTQNVTTLCVSNGTCTCVAESRWAALTQLEMYLSARSSVSALDSTQARLDLFTVFWARSAVATIEARKNLRVGGHVRAVAVRHMARAKDLLDGGRVSLDGVFGESFTSVQALGEQARGTFEAVSGTGHSGSRDLLW